MSLSEEAATLRDLLTRTEKDRERIIQENLEKADREEKAAARREEERAVMKGALDRMEAESAELKKELGEWRQTRMELDAIAEQMKEWEAVKARYEERIKMLTLRLRDALGHKNPGRRNDNESDILEEGEDPYLFSEDDEDRAEINRKTPPSSSLLAPKSPQETPPSSPRTRRLPKDDSDWLLTLPPE